MVQALQGAGDYATTASSRHRQPDATDVAYYNYHGGGGGGEDGIAPVAAAPLTSFSGKSAAAWLPTDLDTKRFRRHRKQKKPKRRAEPYSSERHGIQQGVYPINVRERLNANPHREETTDPITPNGTSLSRSFKLTKTFHVFSHHKMGTVLFQRVILKTMQETLLSDDTCAFDLSTKGELKLMKHVRTECQMLDERAVVELFASV